MARRRHRRPARWGTASETPEMHRIVDEVPPLVLPSLRDPLLGHLKRISGRPLDDGVADAPEILNGIFRDVIKRMRRPVALVHRIVVHDQASMLFLSYSPAFRPSCLRRAISARPIGSPFVHRFWPLGSS